MPRSYHAYRASPQVLRMSKMLERRAWWFNHPMRQLGGLSYDVYSKLEAKRCDCHITATRRLHDRGMAV